ncbi:hypothetical protein scyTo_0020201 [Scyliorhinus torazame]|uniref:Uncharacterized protein n=1 Tax=Scyliorhinus torazame TaxID=75743 RepID=A0A401Q1Y6_SCYTO|nr:hypothetical protein [Scyliorhinus torazame]
MLICVMTYECVNAYNFSDGQQIVVENFESIATVPENSPAGTKIHEFQAIVFNDAVLEIAVTSTPESEFFMITYRRILRTEILNRYIVEARPLGNEGNGECLNNFIELFDTISRLSALTMKHIMRLSKLLIWKVIEK